MLQTNHFRSALVCGLVPLATGTIIFLLWLLTRWSWLQGCGMVTIIAGVALFLLGTTHVGASLLDILAEKPGERRRHLIRPFFALLVLLSNFPAAALILTTVATIHTRYVVTIVNDGPVPLDKVLVSGGGVEIKFGSIKPGTSGQRGFHIRTDGEFVFHARRRGEEVQGMIESYVTNGCGGDMEVAFNQYGAFEVRDKRLRRDAIAD